jgi:predicted SnoaL-like aldol condensation-catalyzing enzyme
MTWMPRKKTPIVLLSAMVAVVGCGQLSTGAFAAEPRESSRTAVEDAKVELVRDFYNLALNVKDFDAASKYLGDKYIQHNPGAGDGPEGLKAFVEFLKREFPQAHNEVKHAYADGDFVILHVHSVRVPGTRGRAIVDIFRLENGKVVEHWDVIQDVPDPSEVKNNNTMF